MIKEALLKQADDLEELAKREEISYVRMFDLQGREMDVSRYDLPKIAMGMRKEAEGMK